MGTQVALRGGLEAAQALTHHAALAALTRDGIYHWYMAFKTHKRGTAKVFMTGRSQAVRIPKEYRFSCTELLIERDGKRVILTPRPVSWRDYFARAT